MTVEQEKFIEPILETFENEDIKLFAFELLQNLPPYIWEVFASSTAKYHPSYTICYGGLMKHQVAVVRFINFFFELEQFQSQFNSRERDLLKVAGLIHDGRKSGEQSDYESNSFTKFDHPIQMANVILSYKGKGFLGDDELFIIADTVSKHMGSWNTNKRSKITLPTPDNKYSEILHLADYLASRKCLEMDFDDYELPKGTLPDINEYRVTFGKHKGKTLIEINKETPDYIEWMRKEGMKEPVATLLKEL